MKSKVIAIVVSAIIFILVLFFLFLIAGGDKGGKEVKAEKTTIKQVEQRLLLVSEGEACNPMENRICKKGLSCKEGVCFPKIDYQEIINPKEDLDLYDVATAGPYKNDYILHVDRLVISEKLYVWIGKRKRPYWFKARRETELRPYQLKVPKGSQIRVKLSNKDKLHPPEFRGKIYLTKP